MPEPARFAVKIQPDTQARIVWRRSIFDGSDIISPRIVTRGKCRILNFIGGNANASACIQPTRDCYIRIPTQKLMLLVLPEDILSFITGVPLISRWYLPKYRHHWCSISRNTCHRS